MHHVEVYSRKLRRGQVLRVCRDHQLRDDIGCGTSAGKVVAASDLLRLGLESDLKQYLILDANVLLAQMDLLEQQGAPFYCLIILQTVLEEVRHNNLSVYRRVKQLLMSDTRVAIFFANEHHSATYAKKQANESINDRNDRAIRIAAEWFASQLGSSVKVLMLTNDKANAEKAREMGLTTQTIQAYVHAFKGKFEHLIEFLAQESPLEDEEAGSAGSKLIYMPHKPMSEIAAGIKAGRYFRGVLRAERRGWKKCYTVIQGPGDEERVAVHITGEQHVNRAMDGDVVAVALLPLDQWITANEPGPAVAQVHHFLPVVSSAPESSEGRQDLMADPTAEEQAEDIVQAQTAAEVARPCGRVVGIVRRSWRPVCGSLEADQDRETADGVSTSALFVPVDQKIPKVRIATRQRAALSNKRILVTIDSWPSHSKFPLGHYLRTLGDVGDRAIETEVVLLDHDIRFEAFSGKVMSCLPPVDWKITPQNSQGRRDLRSVKVVSVDPPGCKDIDDALHARLLGNGNFEVGVHIADVSHFVTPDTALDLEASLRSTSTYLVDRRLDMLPGLLTESLCSLRSGVDRFAFSVVWEVTPDGVIVSADFFKSIIHSVAALTYDQAQLMLDDPKATDEQARSLKILNKLAKVFRKRRMEAGALTLASPEVRFVLDSESQNPTDVQAYSLKDANAMVEEFMLLANITVGKKILRQARVTKGRHFPALSVLRRHPAPTRQQFDQLVSAAAAVGVKIEVEDSKRLARSLDRAQKADDPYFNKLIRIMSTRCMMPAKYFCSGELSQDQWHHYGLATPIYTHFTSPIRRYADLVVHRLLAAAIGAASLPLSLTQKGHLHDLTENMNRRHSAAQMAGRASVSLYTTLYFKHNPATEDAYVMQVFADKIGIIVPRFGIEGTVCLADEFPEDRIKYDEKSLSLKLSVNGTICTIQVFGKVRVAIRVTEGSSLGSQVEMRLVMQAAEMSSTQKRKRDG
ncbi:unnamed protein product [Chrysoparadoxa australica]